LKRTTWAKVLTIFKPRSTLPQVVVGHLQHEKFVENVAVDHQLFLSMRASAVARRFVHISWSSCHPGDAAAAGRKQPGAVTVRHDGTGNPGRFRCSPVLHGVANHQALCATDAISLQEIDQYFGLGRKARQARVAAGHLAEKARRVSARPGFSRLPVPACW
jgi:hypothetical protein